MCVKLDIPQDVVWIDIMHKIIIAIAAMFVLVANVLAGMPEVSPVVDTQNFSNSSNVSNKSKYLSSKAATKTTTKKNKTKHPAHTHLTQTVSPKACWIVENNGVVGYACKDGKKTITNTAAKPSARSGEIIGVEEKNVQSVGAVEEVKISQPKPISIPKKKHYVAPVKIEKVQQISFPKPTFCAGIHSCTGGCAKDAAINSSEKIGERSAVGHPYLGIMAGASFARLGVRQRVSVNGLYDEYIPTDNYSSPVYGVNFGYEFKLGSSGLLSTGVGVYQNLNYISKGQVWDESITIGTHNLDYEYRLQSTRFMFENQFAWQIDLNKIKVIPFVLLGVGPSLNFTHSYVDTLVNPAATLGPGYQSNRNTSFAYQLGAGFACPIGNDSNRLFAAYKYVDLGTAQFNNNGASDDQLDVGRIRANEVYIGYTHLFDF